MKDWTKCKASELYRGDIIENKTVSGRQVTDEVDSVSKQANGKLKVIMKASSQIELLPDAIVEVYR